MRRGVWSVSAVAALCALAAAVADHAATAGSATAPAVQVVLPAGNLVADPSFETGVGGWTGGPAQVRLGAGAPNGSFVARVATTSGRSLALDDWPGPVEATTGGVRYSASISLAAAADQSVGRRAVLVVREHRGGQTVAAWSSAPVPLSTTFGQLSVSGTAARSGDAIDLYAYVVGPAPGDAIYADAASLTSSYPVPVSNTVADASFEGRGQWSVSNARLVRARTGNAPDGAHVGVATWDGRGAYLSVDDWPGEPVTQPGATYAASALVSAGSPSAAGRAARLIVREHTPDGGYVTETDSRAVRLGTDFTALSATATVRRAGDLLDVYVALAHPRPGDALRLDAVSLARSGSTLGELALDVDQSRVLGDTGRYAYVVLQDNESALIPAIRAANPATRILAYEQVGSVLAPDACPAVPAEHVAHTAYPVDYCWLASEHADWLLRSADGTLLTYSDYRHNVLVDVGQPGLRAAWTRAVVSEVRADGFDGVYLDDVNTHPGHGQDGNVARYSDQQYGAVMTGFVRDAGAALRAAGLITMANVAVDPWVGWQVDDAVAMAGTLDVVTKEFWSHYQPSCSTSYGLPFTTPASFDAATGNTDPDLRLELDYATRIQAAGARFAGIDYDQAGDAGRMTYGRATFLLAWDGRAGSAYFNRPAAAADDQGRCAAVDPAEPSWTADIGLPTGPASTSGAVWSRPFTDGVVLVDPSPTTSAAYPLDGTYRSTDGRVLRGSVTLSPGTALVLSRI